VKCCEPKQSKFPSGWAWAHARDCPVSPNQKVGNKVRTRAENKARAAHPAGKGKG
jgi:hypothetical protein